MMKTNTTTGGAATGGTVEDGSAEAVARLGFVANFDGGVYLSAVVDALSAEPLSLIHI